MSAFFIGDVALDEYYTAERWPGPADKGIVSELPAEIGGSIANAAVVHASLGGETEFISLLNDSALSRRLIVDLRANGVGVAHILTDPTIAESRNLIFLVGGEHVVLTVEMGEQPMWLRTETLAALRSPGFLYLTLYRPPPALQDGRRSACTSPIAGRPARARTPCRLRPGRGRLRGS